jgi:asparagine synthase (glutamine-hydrolysing)
MQTALNHLPSHVDGALFVDESISAAGTMHFPKDWTASNRHSSRDGVEIWLNGEFHNTRELVQTYELGGDTDRHDAQLLADLYREYPEFGFLADIDGIFSAVVYDPARNCVFLLSSRHGFSPLFWSRQGDTLIWSSEVKAFLEHPEFEPVIRESSIEHFFDYGHLLGDETWFEGVHLLPSASVLQWDLASKELGCRNYWSWDSVTPFADSVRDRDLVDEMGRLICRAVEKRCRGDYRIGVTLSGGLDSRALLAAIPDDISPAPVTVTFGFPECEDIRIARRVSKTAGVEHYVHELTEDNWFDGRIDGVWYTDGHFPLRHMHSLGGQKLARQHYDVNLNGFLAGAIQGGIYVGDPEFSFVEKLEHRGRRLINEGVRLSQVFLHHRRPFIDHELFEFTARIPEAKRADRSIYHRALLAEFPKLFAEIPWDNTGVPISAPTWREYLEAARRWSQGMLDAYVLNRDKRGGENYTDYPRWIVGPTNREQFESILFGSGRLYPAYISEQRVRDIWERLCTGDTRCEWEHIYRVLTFEIWLQQAFEGEYRPERPRNAAQSQTRQGLK